MKIVEEMQVRQLLTAEKCIGVMEQAFADLENGNCVQPMRSIARMPHGNLFGFMPAWLGDGKGFGAKVLSAFPGNVGTGYHSHNGYVVMFETDHGTMTGMVDASSITEIRTGAVSALATRYMARENSRTMAVIGAGAQGRSHLAAILAVRDIKEVKVYDIMPAAAQRYAQQMSEKYGITVTVAESVEEAVKDADIICTVTPSKEAYLKKEWIKPGAHINAVGTFSPTTREVTSELVAASRLIADSMEGILKESGEYLIPLQEGLITEEHIAGTLGELVTGKKQGRTSAEEITLFDALGLAVEDVASAAWVLEQV